MKDNEDLTTDGNVSYETINDLRDVIKYFGMSNHTTSNLPKKNRKNSKPQQLRRTA